MARILNPSMDVAYTSCSKTGGSSLAALTSITTRPLVGASSGSGAGQCDWMIVLTSSGERVVRDTAFRSDGMVWFGRTYRYTNLWRWLKQLEVGDTDGQG